VIFRASCHPKPRRPVVSRKIVCGGDRQRAVRVANNPVTDIRLRTIIVHEPGTAVSPVVPDAGNTVGIWVRIIERAVCDPQGFDFRETCASLSGSDELWVKAGHLGMDALLKFKRWRGGESAIGWPIRQSTRPDRQSSVQCRQPPNTHATSGPVPGKPMTACSS
jgi:hypothetical protein